MKILFAESNFWDKEPEFVEEYKQLITKTFEFVKTKFPIIPDMVTFVCQTNDWECIPETGEGGNTKSSRLVLLSLDPQLPYPKETLLKNVESAVLHELSHVARYEAGIFHKSFIDNCIMEGLATVFERENTNRKPLWSEYDESEVKDWYKEIVDLGNSANYSGYMYSHSDGRRWIGYRVGTWIVESALQKTGKSVEDLMLLECDEIIKQSGL